MKEILWRLLALCLGILMLAGCGQESASPSAAPIPVKVGMLRLASSAPLFIGIEKGYFAEEGIAPEPVWFDAAQPIAVATASNAIDDRFPTLSPIKAVKFPNTPAAFLS